LNGPSFPAAAAVAERAQAHFARQLSLARDRGYDRLAAEPDAAAIEAIVDAAFWASLRREEGYVPRISLAFLPPEQAGQPLVFAQPLPLAPDALTRFFEQSRTGRGFDRQVTQALDELLRRGTDPVTT